MSVGLGSFVVTTGRLVVSDRSTEEIIPCATNGTWHAFVECVPIRFRGLQNVSLTLIHDAMLNESLETSWTKNDFRLQSEWISIGVFDADQWISKDRGGKRSYDFDTRWIRAIADSMKDDIAPIGDVVDGGVVVLVWKGGWSASGDVVKDVYNQIVAVSIDFTSSMSADEQMEVAKSRKVAEEGGR